MVLFCVSKGSGGEIADRGCWYSMSLSKGSDGTMMDRDFRYLLPLSNGSDASDVIAAEPYESGHVELKCIRNRHNQNPMTSK